MRGLSPLQIIYGSSAVTLAATLVATDRIAAHALNKLLHPTRKKNNWSPADVGLPYEDVTIQSDNIPLTGWLVPGKEQSNSQISPLSLAILLHGYTSNRTKNPSSLPLMKFFHEMGISTLSYDARAHGESGGERSTIGYEEPKDLAAVYALAQQRKYKPNILYGRSMGAATIAMHANKLTDIQLTIMDSPFTRLDDILKHDFTNWTPLPKYPFTPMIIAKARAQGLYPEKVRPIDKMTNPNFPRTLLIHSIFDNLIRPDHSIQIHNKHPNSRLILTKSLGHTNSFLGFPADYKKTEMGELTDYGDYPRQYLENMGHEMERMGMSRERIQDALGNTLGDPKVHRVLSDMIQDPQIKKEWGGLFAKQDHVYNSESLNEQER